ncbi:FAD/NAD(P)-binding domain-containing protein [Zymoseptoria brevis]|uniref:FAD/NAD(P)-binding domain-containing protein n=1 Tax=Zymoseptoria brevis TaxID=1047168 RepID=A0A0F4GC63_9PEZI|nr:FAD/NAD(P)-binding domain-containing protein [Zymoseptoria brevis]
MSTTTKPPTLIIGAGLTGLILAHALQHISIPHLIFDAESPTAHRTRLREWNMAVHWSIPLLQELLPKELYDRFVAESAVDPSLDPTKAPFNGARIFDGYEGGCLKDLEEEGGVVRVSRRKMRGWLLEGVDVKFDHKLESITYNDDDTVTAHFNNSTSSTGRLLIGADGPRSTIRSLLFDNSPSALTAPMSNSISISSVFSYPTAELNKQIRDSTHPTFSMMVHPEIFLFISMQDVPDPNDPSTWVFNFFACWRGEPPSTTPTSDELRDLIVAKSKDLHEPYRSVIAHLPPDAVFTPLTLATWTAQPWPTHGGRITLAGDAAHPMLPFRGQGLNNAIQDVANLVAGLEMVEQGELGLEDMVEGYSGEVARRGAEATSMSVKSAEMTMEYWSFKESPMMKMGLRKV